MPYRDAKYPPANGLGAAISELLRLCMRLDCQLSDPPHRSWIENKHEIDALIGQIRLQARAASEEVVLG